MQKVAILGLGLMGSSLGCALKKMLPSVEVFGYARRSATRDAALKSGVCDDVSERVDDAVKGADIVVVCVPVQTIPDLIKSCKAGLSDGAIVTDVGSTTAVLGAEIEKLLSDTKAHYVGSHPIAGGELEGLEAAREDLYQDATVIITHSQRTAQEDIDKIKALWETIGENVEVMSAEQHDAVLARNRHLP